MALHASLATLPFPDSMSGWPCSATMRVVALGEGHPKSIPADEVEVAGEPLAVDVGRRVPDVSKIRDRLGWSAAVSLDEGIRRTVDWYREQLKLSLAGRTE